MHKHRLAGLLLESQSTVICILSILEGRLKLSVPTHSYTLPTYINHHNNIPRDVKEELFTPLLSSNPRGVKKFLRPSCHRTNNKVVKPQLTSFLTSVYFATVTDTLPAQRSYECMSSVRPSVCNV